MKRPSDRKDPVLSAKDWARLGMVILGVCLICAAVSWMAEHVGSLSGSTELSTAEETQQAAVTRPTHKPPAEAVSEIRTWDAPIEPPVIVPAHEISDEEAVQITIDDLRRHAHDSPEAPDVLSEERIQAIAARNALVE